MNPLRGRRPAAAGLLTPVALLVGTAGVPPLHPRPWPELNRPPPVVAGCLTLVGVRGSPVAAATVAAPLPGSFASSRGGRRPGPLRTRAHARRRTPAPLPARQRVVRQSYTSGRGPNPSLHFACTGRLGSPGACCALPQADGLRSQRPPGWPSGPRSAPPTFPAGWTPTALPVRRWTIRPVQPATRRQVCGCLRPGARLLAQHVRDALSGHRPRRCGDRGADRLTPGHVEQDQRRRGEQACESNNHEPHARPGDSNPDLPSPGALPFELYRRSLPGDRPLARTGSPYPVAGTTGRRANRPTLFCAWNRAPPRDRTGGQPIKSRPLCQLS